MFRGHDFVIVSLFLEVIPMVNKSTRSTQAGKRKVSTRQAKVEHVYTYTLDEEDEFTVSLEGPS